MKLLKHIKLHGAPVTLAEFLSDSEKLFGFLFLVCHCRQFAKDKEQINIYVLHMKGNLCNLLPHVEINETASSLYLFYAPPPPPPTPASHLSLPPDPLPLFPQAYPHIPTSHDQRTVADLHTLSCTAAWSS